MSEDIRISPIRPELVDTIWAEAANMLAPALATAEGKLEIQDVRDQIMSGVLVLWMIWRKNKPVAFYTTRIVEYPQCRAMAIDWVGGEEMRHWMDQGLDELEKHARNNKCQHIEGYGRVAWGRVLKRRGWKPEYVAYRMELSDGQ